MRHSVAQTQLVDQSRLPLCVLSYRGRCGDSSDGRNQTCQKSFMRKVSDPKRRLSSERVLLRPPGQAEDGGRPSGSLIRTRSNSKRLTAEWFRLAASARERLQQDRLSRTLTCVCLGGMLSVRPLALSCIPLWEFNRPENF